MALVFSEPYKHGRIEFMPGVPLGFEAPEAEAFFQKIGVASATDDEAVRIYSAEEVEIDSDTRFADGAKVLEAPENAPGARERQGHIQPDDQTVTSNAS